MTAAPRQPASQWPPGAPVSRHVRAVDGLGSSSTVDRQRWQAGGWRSKALPAYKRLTVQAERPIAGAYLAGTNTRRVRRALAALFGGAVGKDTVRRAWRKLQSDWEAWRKRDLAGHDIIRLISTARLFGFAWAGRRPAFRCWWPWAFVVTARKY